MFTNENINDLQHGRAIYFLYSKMDFCFYCKFATVNVKNVNHCVQSTCAFVRLPVLTMGAQKSLTGQICLNPFFCNAEFFVKLIMSLIWVVDQDIFLWGTS